MRYLFIIYFFLLFGCSSIYLEPRSPKIDYRWSIENWQQKIKKEGWSEETVNQVVKECLRISTYMPEPTGQDHWKTYKEFIEDFKGDCEDISAFIFGTLKRLEYPNGIRMRILHMPTGDHAVIMVELPQGRWKLYNSVPRFGDFVDLALSRTVVEWDEENIYYNN